MKRFVAYFRVSTSTQGKSGLGLDAQKTMVNNYINSNDGELVSSFTEVETGTSKKKRTVIYEAIEFAKQNDAVLVIANLSRLARNVHFVSCLMEAGVEFVCCDMPSANNLTIFLMSAIAEDEARLVSSRTKLALAELKNRGVLLGNPENLKYEHRLLGAKAMKEKSLTHKANVQATALICEYREKGMSYDKIVEQLTKLNFMTVNNKKFTSTSVMRLYKRHLEQSQINEAA